MDMIARVLAPAWIIVVGGLMIIPGAGGPIINCIVCGPTWNLVIAVVSIVLGAIGLWSYFAAGQR